jgi:PucR family transcriptional regulator, purine catabolism regulatory protein
MRPPSRSRRSGRTVAHVTVVDAGGATLGTGWPPTEPGRRRCLRSGYPARLRERVSDQIGPLIEADRTGSGALCQTLETYLGIGNAAAAARLIRTQ